MNKIIAIAGGSGAGKTTLALALSRLLAAPVIAEDDYYHCASAIADFDAASYNFDTPHAKDHALLLAHLQAARAGASFDKPIYDLATHRRSPETQRVTPAPALIVEGMHLLTPELRAIYNLSVFISADEALRLGRRMVRDVEARGRSPRGVLAQFFTYVRPMHEAHVEPQRLHADLVLTARHGDSPSSAEQDARRIAALLDERS